METENINTNDVEAEKEPKQVVSVTNLVLPTNKDNIDADRLHQGLKNLDDHINLLHKLLEPRINKLANSDNEFKVIFDFLYTRIKTILKDNINDFKEED